MAESGRLVRVGAIDCGTNSIRLLVADVDRETGALTDVLRRMEIVRLGYGVDRTGRIDPEAMERTLAMSREYAGQCASLGAEAVRFAATSASRDAANAAEFVAGVREAFGVFGTTPEVITGDEEAALSFRGATGDVVAAGIDGPYLVVDLGGGSTEFVRGTGSVEAARSVDIGCVRMTERHLHSDPPTEDEIAAASRDVEAAVSVALQAVPVDGVRTLVGLAGSVTTVTAQAWSLPYYDPRRIHLAVTPVSRMTGGGPGPARDDPGPPGGASVHASGSGGRHRRGRAGVGRGDPRGGRAVRPRRPAHRGLERARHPRRAGPLPRLSPISRRSPDRHRRGIPAGYAVCRARPAVAESTGAGSTVGGRPWAGRSEVSRGSGQAGLERGDDLRPQLAGLDHLVHRTDLDRAVDAVDRVELGRHLAQLLRAHR